MSTDAQSTPQLSQSRASLIHKHGCRISAIYDAADAPFTKADVRDALDEWDHETDCIWRRLVRDDLLVDDGQERSSGGGLLNQYVWDDQVAAVIEALDYPTMPNCECRRHIPPGTGPYQCRYCGTECSRAELQAALDDQGGAD